MNLYFKIVSSYSHNLYLTFVPDHDQDISLMCLFPQAPVFISFFIALRKMAYLPVPSMQTGGLLWFPDLTLGDPFYILPVVVTGTMFFILEVRLFLFNI